jgi:hypothetical protein
MKPIQVRSNKVASNTRVTQRVPSRTDKALWNVTPCSPTDTYRHYVSEGTISLVIGVFVCFWRDSPQ